MGVQKITDGIARISLAWSNAYVLYDTNGGKSATLIDCGLQKDRPALIAGLRTLGLEPSDVQTVLLTHAHCDHAGNAAYFANIGAALVTHEHETCFLQLPRRSYAYSGWNALRRPFTSLTFAIGEFAQPVERCEVSRTLKEGDIVEAPGGTLRVVYSPGHAPGHIAFYREHDQILFSGDAILNIVPNLVPAWRKTALSLPPRLLCDDWKQVHESARRLVELSPRLLLSGHGLPLVENAAATLRLWASRYKVREE